MSAGAALPTGPTPHLRTGLEAAACDDADELGPGWQNEPRVGVGNEIPGPRSRPEDAARKAGEKAMHGRLRERSAALRAEDDN